MGLSQWSVSACLKQKLKSALNYVTDFEVAVANEARRRGYAGNDLAVSLRRDETERLNVFHPDAILIATEGLQS